MPVSSAYSSGVSKPGSQPRTLIYIPSAGAVRSLFSSFLTPKGAGDAHNYVSYGPYGSTTHTVWSKNGPTSAHSPNRPERSCAGPYIVEDSREAASRSICGYLRGWAPGRGPVSIAKEGMPTHARALALESSLLLIYAPCVLNYRRTRDG